MNKPAIICVDDENIILTSLQDQLNRHFKNNYVIELAENGEIALEIIHEHMANSVDIPVIIADQIMPGIKGDELLTRTHEMLPDTYNILLTGQADAQAVGNAVNQASLYRYIAKPWEPTDLILTIKEAVHSYFQKRQVAELRQRNQRLVESLDAFSRLVDPVAAYKSLLTHACHQFKASTAAILVKEPQSDDFSIVGVVPLSTNPAFPNNVLVQAWGANDMIQYQNPDSAASSWICPIRSNKKVIGLLCLNTPDASVETIQMDQIAAIIAPILEQQKNARQVQLEAEIHNLGLFVGQSPAMKQVYTTIEQVAKLDLPVYIHGETGTGKELVATALHKLSPRRDKPFIAVNCAAIPRDLAEDELFGHEKGAFTGATDCKAGKFELADNGTLFLDEIADLPIEMQAKLLRVLDENQIWPVGGQSSRAVNVRVVAATSSSLGERIRQGSFRPDLYHRLNVLTIQLPPLRDRKDDIQLLAHHFLQKYTELISKKVPGFTRAAMDYLMKHTWPGNIRELENTIAKAVVANPANQPIHQFSASAGYSTFSADTSRLDWLTGVTLDDMHESLEKFIVEQVLQRHNRNKNRTSDELNISRNRLNRIIERHNLG